MKKTPNTNSTRRDSRTPEEIECDREADGIKELLSDPKANKDKVDVVVGALVELSNELGINYSEPGIAWNLYHAAREAEDRSPSSNEHVQTALADITEVLNGATKRRIKAMQKRHDAGKPRRLAKGGVQ